MATLRPHRAPDRISGQPELSVFLFGTNEEIRNLLGRRTGRDKKGLSRKNRRQYARMSIRELGAIQSDQGNFVPTRWNDDTGVDAKD